MNRTLPKISLLIAASLVGQRAGAQVVPAPSGKQWATTWSDEFNNGQSDLTGWTYDLGGGGWGNNEREVYTNSTQNVFVATDPTTGTGALNINAIGTAGSGSIVNYTSGRIRTTNIFSQTYGLIEFCAKFPAGNGLWPALWMMPKDNAYGGWPTSGEIDVFEGKGQDMGWAQSTLHSGPAGGDNAQSRTFAESGLRPPGFSTAQWHTYDVKWDQGAGTGPSTFTFYIDGVAYHTRTGGWTVPAGQPASAPFDKPFYLIMNLAVGGTYVGGLTPGVGTYNMQVDYARAYSSISSTATPSWKNDASGIWSNAANWTNAVIPNSVDAVASFGSAITQARTVTVDTPIVAGELRFSNSNRYTIDGTQTVTLSASGTNLARITDTAGSHTVSAPLVLNDDTGIHVQSASSALSLTNLQPSPGFKITKSGLGTLSVNHMEAAALFGEGGPVALTATGGANLPANRIGTMSFAGGVGAPAVVDLNDQDLIVTSTPRATIESQIVAARHGGAWDQAGITSAAAKAQASHATTLGVLSGAEYHGVAGGSATFGSFAVADSDVLVKYTWYGDTDFNGVVNFDDYVRTDSGFNNQLSGWLNGDFDLNGVVNFDDYVLIDLAFNSQSGTLRRALNFLDGSDRSLNGMSDPALRKVEQHFDQFGDAYARHFLAAVPEPSCIMTGGLASAGMLCARKRKHPHSSQHTISRRRTNA
jgi:beta-glucanase (GH16 family)